MKHRFLAIMLSIALSACTTAQEHRAAVANNDTDRLTVGTVQREISVGMSSSDVVTVLGSPNMVTTDDQRRETWVYDKISTEKAYSASSGGVNTLFLGGGLAGGALLGGGLGGNYGSTAGATSTSQRTLTIIIKFDNQSKVRDFAYRSSSF
ncbi:MAG: hypothetical protein GC131_07970 [Alphaproteobacteria bacterium]|nr:hypothetical protein [Alphaproteobacteria bacterium]